MIIPEKIQVETVNIFQAKLETGEEFMEQPRSPASFKFSFAHNIAHHPAGSRSRYRLFFQLDALDEKENPIGLSIEYGIEFHFHVENFKDFIKEEDGQIQMSADLGATLLGMAYSTARGIIFERTRGTYFERGVVLPVIDPFKALLGKSNKQ